MKIKQTISLSILGLSFLTSCEKNLYDPSQEEPKTNIKEMVISDDFSWKMTKDADCTVTSNDAAFVSIYRDASYSENSLLATIPVKSGYAPTLPIALLEDMQNVYITYAYAQNPNEIKKTKAEVQNGIIQFTVPNNPTSRAIRSNEEEGFEEQGSTIFYPSKGGGTIMFEDNYPLLGDYDFNDFVSYYCIEITTYPNSQDVKSINFYMAVRAIGATYKFIPQLRLTSFSTSSLDGDILVHNEGFDNLNVQLLSDSKPGKDGKIVLAFNGAEDKEGTEFLNVEKGSKPSPPKKFDVTLNFKPGCSIEYLYIDKFDIFLASSDKKKEIHMLGYGPAFTTDGYNNTNYYKDPKTNLVWGISIPDIVDHTYEKENFLQAYSKFADWVTEKPGATKDWYKYGNSEFLFPMSF